MSQRNVEEDEFLDKLWALVQKWRDSSPVVLVECFDRKDRGIAMGRAGCADELEALIGGDDE